MRIVGVPYKPRYSGDELAVGVVGAVLLHFVVVAPFVVKAIFPSARSGEDERPPIAAPYVEANLLKLGRPVNPAKLPDRFIPKKNLAPKKERVASREDPSKEHPDAGAPPPPDAEDSDIKKLITNSNLTSLDAGSSPLEGHADGVDGGTEMDRSKVHPGLVYPGMLRAFLHQKWVLPSVISVGEASKLCVPVSIATTRDMKIWNVSVNGTSGNQLFDDSVRSLLYQLRDSGAQLPQPPADEAERFRQRSIPLSLCGG
ncbi:MAG TPA: TonB C-terminal domain-containing protein [Labilithrix sp.]